MIDLFTDCVRFPSPLEPPFDAITFIVEFATSRALWYSESSPRSAAASKSDRASSVPQPAQPATIS